MVATVTSQTLLDFFTILLFFGILIDFYRNRPFNSAAIKKLNIEWAFFGYIFVICIGFLVNAATDAEVARSLFKFTWMLNLFIYIYAFAKITLDTKRILVFLSTMFLIPNFYAIDGYVSQLDLVTKTRIARAIGLVNSSTYHAHGNAIIFVMFCAIFYFVFKKISARMRIFSGLCLTVFFFSIFFTFVRGIWLSIFLSCFTMAFFISFRKFLGVLLSTLVIVSILYSVSPQFRDRLNPVNSIASSEERNNLMKLNLQIFKEYPMFGIGYGENLRRNREFWDKPEWNLPKDYITSHAHNQYINVLATTGVFGFFFFMSFMLFFLHKNWRMLKSETNKSTLRYALIFGCLWAQIEFFLACLTDVTFEYAKIRALYLMVWALLIAIERHGEEIIVESA